MFDKRATAVIDLAGPLKALGGPSLYYAVDGHWTQAGHRAAGEILTPAVAKAIGR